MKRKTLTRQEFIVKTSKALGGVICTPMLISLFQSCDKPDILNSGDESTLYYSECPCHNSQFDQDGQVIQHPSTGDTIDPLNTYSATINDNSITIEGSNANILLSDHPELEDVGGVSYLDSIDIDNHGILLYRKNINEIIVLSRVCTHESCTIGTFQSFNS